MAKIRITMELSPVLHRAAFDDAFARANSKWPGVELGYVGTDDKGNHYFQEWGNKTPFVLEPKK